MVRVNAVERYLKPLLRPGCRLEVEVDPYAEFVDDPCVSLLVVGEEYCIYGGMYSTVLWRMRQGIPFVEILSSPRIDSSTRKRKEEYEKLKQKKIHFKYDKY